MGDWTIVFLAEYRRRANVFRSCEAAGVTRQAAYARRDRDPDFARAWSDAAEDAADRLEERAYERAEDGSDLLMIVLLKAVRPEKYREPRGTNIEKLNDAELDTFITAAESAIAQARARREGAQGTREAGE